MWRLYEPAELHHRATDPDERMASPPAYAEPGNTVADFFGSGAPGPTVSDTTPAQ